MKDFKTPLISVIIPVYNVEEYLRECLSSVINQTYKNLEIICINDFSQDNSEQILKEFALRDNRIKVINNSYNMKAGLTRNVGIENASGDYIHFLDADDWLELGAYQKLVEIISVNPKADFINFSYIKYKSEKNKKPINTYQCKFNELIDISESKSGISDVHIAPWAKIVRTDILKENGIKFNEFECHEDFEYTIRLILASKFTYFVDEHLVFHRMRPNSLISKHAENSLYVLKTLELIGNLTKDKKEDVQIPIMNFAYNNFVEYVFELYDSGKIDYKRMKELFLDNIDLKIAFDKRNSKSSLRDRLRVVLDYNANFAFKIKYYIKLFFPTAFYMYLNIKKSFLTKIRTKS